ncbi:MAG: hypothetical protein ACOX4G_02040 [Limnochordia bacterium]|jgi:archaellum component FlaC
MQQPVSGSGWCERLELVLEGGGKLPGAIRIVDIRDKVLACTADREDDKALVRGQLQVFVYYNIDGCDRVQGQGAEIPWHFEVPIPPAVEGALEARVVEVRHDHSYDPKSEQLRHTMHVAFEVWNIDAQPAEQPVCHSACDGAASSDAIKPIGAPLFEPEPAANALELELSETSDSPDSEAVLTDPDSEDIIEPHPSDSDEQSVPAGSTTRDDPSEMPCLDHELSLETSDSSVTPEQHELQPTDVVIADTVMSERLDDLENQLHQMRSEFIALRKELESLREWAKVETMVETSVECAKELAPVVEELAPVVEELAPVVEELTPVVEELTPVVEELTPQPAKPKPEREVLVWRPFPRI